MLQSHIEIDVEKRDFMTEFVFRRCLGGNNGTDGKKWAEEAEVAWELIKNKSQTKIIDGVRYND